MDLCDHSNAYIVVGGRTSVRATANTDIGQKDIAFKNNAWFKPCITKIDSTLIDDAENIVMPMYNLLEYNQNYGVTPGSLRNCYKDKINYFDKNASDSKSFKYKTKIIGKTEARPARPPQPDQDQNGNQPQPEQPPILSLNTEVTVPHKYLRNFWRPFDLPLINGESEVDFN